MKFKPSNTRIDDSFKNKNYADNYIETPFLPIQDAMEKAEVLTN